MKKCLVISGQYRTFDITWRNIKNFIDLNELDVYAHLWSIDENEIKNVKDRLNPVKILTEYYPEHQKYFDDMETRIKSKNPKNLIGNDNLSGAASMHYSRKKAFDLVNKCDYDVVVYCRYDININQNFYFETVNNVITPEENSYALISDIFSVMPMSMADSYFLFDEYESLQSSDWESEFIEWLRNVKKYPERDILTHIHNRYCPHLMLMRNILKNGHSFEISNLPVSTQR